MRPHCQFPSEVLSRALYQIMNWDFIFTKRNCHWKCKMADMMDLIDLIELAIGQPRNYNVPPISINIWGTITIKQGDNQILLNEELMIRFLEELKMVYEVYA